MQRAAILVLSMTACGAPQQQRSTIDIPESLRPPRDGQLDLETLNARREHPTDAPAPRPIPPDHPVAPPADIGLCLRGRMCELEGMCTASEEHGNCIAASDDDCRPSDACLGGRCTAKEGHCVATSDEECRKSWACKGYGACVFDGDEACTAASVADCEASTRCKREGYCALAAGECIKPPR